MSEEFTLEVYSADSRMFGFQEWAKENNITVHYSDDYTGKVIIYFEDDADLMAAKLRWL